MNNAKIENAISAPSRAQRLLSCNDILFQTVRPYQQNNYLFCGERNLPSVASTGYAVFRTRYDVQFLYALIHTKHFLNLVLSRCTGTSFPAISASDIENIIVSIPSIDEQSKIGEFFRLINAKIQKQKILVEFLKKYKRGLHKQIFTPKPHWSVKPLRDIATFCGGGTPSKDVSKYWQGNIGWISSSDVQEDWIDEISISRRIAEEAISNSATKLCPKGTIAIISRVGVGKVAIMPEDLCTSQDYTNITTIHGDITFFAYQIAHRMKIEASKTQGTAIKGVTADTIKSMEMDIPDIDEQRRIATTLKTFDYRIKHEIYLLSFLQNIKKALLQQLFI